MRKYFSNRYEYLRTSNCLRARLFPDKVALVFEGQAYTYRALDQLSVQAASKLSKMGIARGDRIALSLPNVPAFVVWYYATLRLGAIAVSISTRLTGREVADILADCDAKVLIAIAPAFPLPLQDGEAIALQTNECGSQCEGTEFETACDFESTWTDANPEEPALILYTSGTTGSAKGVTLSHSNVRSNVEAFNHLCHMVPEDRMLLAVPLFHCFGQNALLNSAFHVGATIVLQRKFDLQEAKQLIQAQRVTQLYGVPLMFQLLLDSGRPEEMGSINYCFSAAAKLPIQVSEQWLEKFGMPIHEGYGLTETSPFASYNHRLQYVLGSIGTPIDAVEMAIVDTETKEPCAVGELGEIAIRGPNVMLGYWNRPEETAQAVRNGWFYSGDIGRQDEKGFFYIVDRVKDMIAVGGMKVYPAEVERVLMDHPSISDVAVVGFPDPVFGEQVVAFLIPGNEKVPSNDLAEQMLQFARKNLANFKVPKQVVFVEEIPRNPSGKVLKTELRGFDLNQTLAQSANGDTAQSSTSSLPLDSTSQRCRSD